LGQIPTWNATLGASWQASDKLNLNVQFRDYAKYWNNTAHTQRNEGAFTADVGANYQASSNLQLYAVAQNLFGHDYYDQGLTYLADGSLNSSSSGSIPQYAMPFNVTIGAKYRF
jgi:outer membrane receptor protein involved in Fe transport